VPSSLAISALLNRVVQALEPSTRKTVLLSAIGWPSEVETAFFAGGASHLPEVTYEIDREAARQRISELTALEESIDASDDVGRWLRASVHSFIDGNRMLLAVGTRYFYLISRELYGSARDEFAGSHACHLDLAKHVLARLQTTREAEPEPTTLDAHAFADRLRARLAVRSPPLAIEVLVEDRLIARVQAGMSRVRIRSDARFAEDDIDNLWSHEIETHALTAHNGAAQPRAPFLRAGGPRSTRTQEGLATFAELYDHDLSIERMQQLAQRVKMVDMAEQGADFIELYRFALEHEKSPRDAFLDAQRICRGGLVTGGAPFTKDLCYLSGLMEVYTFLSVMVRGDERGKAEMAVAGRIALEDIPTLHALEQDGVLTRPLYLPRWLSHWRGLLPYFALTSFLTEFNLDEVARRFRSS
jgi:uncharacterized protein (TIGR02421 family)